MKDVVITMLYVKLRAQKIVGHTAPPEFVAEMNKMATEHVRV